MLKKFLGIALIAALLAPVIPAFAYDHDHDHGHDDHGWHGDHRWGHGYVVRRIPAGYRSIFWGGVGYLYAEGLFYRYTPSGYIIAEPPYGAAVPFLPAGCTTVLVHGRPYYYYEDTYYAQAPGGYVVTAPPTVPIVQEIAPTPVVSTAVSYRDAVDTYEIQIPNNDGSYTLVTLKKVEKGFVGPQGEFYPEHPTVEKLKILYGKK